MPQTTVEWRRDATADELHTRAAEMRGEWAEHSKLDRESDTYRKAKSEFLAEVEDISTHLTLRGLEAMPAALRGGTVGGDGEAQGTLDTRRSDPATVVLEDEAFQTWAKGASRASAGSMQASPTVEIRSFHDVEFRALVSEGDANGSATLLPVGQPFLVDTRRRRLFIRDLLGVQQTTLSSVPYVRELNPTANQTSASTVAEGAVKPEALMQFTPDNAPVEVIATNIPITRQILEDATTLVGYINGRLTYMLKYREEDELLRGNGLAPDLKGIMTYAGIQAQGTAGTGEYAITLGNAIAKIELVDGFADGVAMNPATYWSMVTHRAAAGSGTFDAQAFTNAPLQYVWGLPVVRTNSMNTNQNLVGNFGMGATIFDRSQSGVRVFEQHSDFAVKNQVLLLAEERIALAVNRPDFFCIATTS